MCNVLPFVSNWTNDVFSRLFVQYVKLIRKKTKIMRCYLKTVDAHFLPPVIQFIHRCHELWMDSSFDAFLSIRFFHYSFYQGLYMKGIHNG